MQWGADGADHRQLCDINLIVGQGEVTCVLGDNGAGQPTLIKIIFGLRDDTEGEMRINEALAPLMSVWRNFFLGNRSAKGRSSTWSGRSASATKN